MVLELIINPLKLRQSPLLMFVEAMVLTFISVLFAVFLFPNKYTSIAILAFITIGALPLFNKLYSHDSYLFNYNKPFFGRHKTLIMLLLFFFFGIFCAFVITYLFAPTVVSVNIFSAQFSELNNVSQIKDSITGNAVAVTTGIGATQFKQVFKIIFMNNLLVVLSAVLLSFFYGAGGLFLISWNASILAAVIVKDISSSFANISGSLTSIGLALWNTIINFLSYLPHGLFEIIAYFIVSVAAAMFARDLFKGLLTTEFGWVAVSDFLYMFLIAILFLLIGALIEASYFI